MTLRRPIPRVRIIAGLLLFVTAQVLCFRTHVRTEGLEYAWPDRYGYILAHKARLIFVITRQPPAARGWSYVDHGPHARLLFDNILDWKGEGNAFDFAGFSGARSKRRAEDWVAIPLWSFMLIGATMAGAFVFRSSRRSKVGHCPACGYDLRASSVRCPECGREY